MPTRDVVPDVSIRSPVRWLEAARAAAIGVAARDRTRHPQIANHGSKRPDFRRT
jgi:hypothetical protein